MPNSGKHQEYLERELEEVGLDPADIYFTAAVKCRNFELSPSNGDVKSCRYYLDQELDRISPSWVLALGNEALLSTTGHSGITKYRGRVIEKNGYKVFPTLAAASIQRNPGQRAAWVADLRLFVAQVFNQTSKVPEPKILIVDTKKKVKSLATLLQKADYLSYDIETNGFSEFANNARIVSLAGTMGGDNEDGKAWRAVWALPLYHPESPFKRNWRSLLLYLADYLTGMRKQIAHNGKFDARWLREFQVPARVTFDTMLAAHILDENRQKGLKPQAASRLGVAPWEIDTKELLNTPLATVLKYNALDTYYTYNIYLPIRDELKAQPRLARIFSKILMPANEILIEAERHGVWIDREKLATNTKIAFDMRDEIDKQLTAYVPSGSDEDLLAQGWPTKGKKPKPAELNFNTSNWLRWFLFEHLELPVIERGKDKDDGSDGAPSVKESVMMELRGQHPVVELLLERSKWQKYCSSFLTAYDEIADANDRIHTSFKLFGTVTGRLSSGKEESDKITSKKVTNRGVNLQQVPRDKFIRGLFGAPPGFVFVEADFSQVELRVVAFLSRDKFMMHLYQTGQDIHLATAARTLGIPTSQVTKEDRKKAKAVNFGFVYGMGWKKFVQTAFEKYELIVSEEESRAVRKAFFDQFPGLLPWHARQRRLVNQYGRVQSPLGRIRHLPDIFSADQGVRAEAERQSINSPVQSFASDMTMLSMIEIHRKFKKSEMPAKIIGTVHDSLLFEVRQDCVGQALPVIKDTMENLPLDTKFGVDLDVPIVADLTVGEHWGLGRELSEEEVYNWQG